MGGWLSWLGTDAKHLAGDAVSGGARLLGDGLDAVGLDSAGAAVTAAGVRAGFDLGASVPELGLGQSSDPAELVHGSPGAIRGSAVRLRGFSSAFGETASGLSGLDPAGWSGAAADAFRAKFQPHPGQWQKASGASGTAAGALESYAGAVESAQARAGQAIELWDAGQRATAAATAAYNQQVTEYDQQAQAFDAALAGGRVPGDVPAAPGPFADPGAGLRARAQQVLDGARAARDAASARAASALRSATSSAPAEPSLLSQFSADLSDAREIGDLLQTHVDGGVIQGAADIVKFAQAVNPQNPWNQQHPVEYLAGLSGTAAGLADDAVNPKAAASTVLGAGWGTDPGAAFGRLLPQAAAIAWAGGAGAGADAGTGAAAGLGADGDPAAAGLGNAAEDAGAASRGGDQVPQAADPVDVATGDVVMSADDVTLAGVLPLVVSRAYRSSFRGGRWFGPGWASTFDQRLRVEAGRVVGLFADGRVLSWPRPGDGGGAGDAGGGDGDGWDRDRGDAGDEAEGDGNGNGNGGGAEVWPVAGPRWPLARDSGGGYQATDPQAGVVWRFAPRSGHYLSPDGLGELPLVSVTDRAGHEITFGYAVTGGPIWVAHSGGYEIKVVPGSGGRIAGLVLAGRGGGADVPLIKYSYDSDGNLAGIVNSSGKPLRLTYDGAGRLAGWQDRNGHCYRYDYDGQGRCVRGEGPGGALSGTFSYDPGDRMTRWADAAGAVTVYEADESGRLAAETDPLGNATSFGYDGHGRLLWRADPLGRVTRWSYDGAGNLAEVTRPDDSRVTARYNEQNLPVLVTGPDGAAWRQDYDERGNLARQEGPDGAVTRYAYDDRGHLAAVTDPAGAVTGVECDPAGLPVSVTGPDRAVTRLARDGFGQVTAITGTDGAVTQLAWTVEGRLASRVLPDGTAERWAYDGEGNLTSHLDPAARLARYDYGPFDKLAARTAPDETRTVFTYDHALRLTAVEHGGLAWRYEHDPAGRLAAETDYNGAVTRYAYDPAGQLASRLNAAGQHVRYTYDLLGNLAERDADGAVTSFGYDRAGRLARASNDDAEITLQRDPAGRVTAETCNGRTLTREYDHAGRQTRRVTPLGAETLWDYDAAGRPAAVHASGQSIRFGYDQAGRETARDLPGGVRLTQEWDRAGRLAAQVLTAGARPGDLPADVVPDGAGAAAAPRVLQHRGYSYRADGCLLATEDLLAGPRRLSLDQAGQVTAVTGPGWAESYGYDPAGNITAAAWPGPPGPATATADGGAQGPREYAGTLLIRAGDVRYRHDAQGRLTSRQQVRLSRKPDNWNYTWDAGNRLTSVTTPDRRTWRYLYDPLGRRITKQCLRPDGQVARQIDFTWDGFVLAEQATLPAGDASGTGGQVITWDYQPGTFTPVAQAEAEPSRKSPQEEIDRRFYAVVTDLIGAPAELVGADGDLAGRQQRTLWGGTAWASGGAATPLRFPGQYHDPETGLHYNNHRYYDPGTGRYLSPDPLGLAPAPNPHAYVPNPTTHTDPLGLMSCSQTGTKTILLPADAKEAINARNIEPWPGFRDVVVHGNETSFSFETGGPVFGPHVMAEIIRADPTYGFEPIRIVACKTGAPGATFAQQLANELGVEVVAPTHTAWVAADGRLLIGPTQSGGAGIWRSFWPQK